MRKLQNQNNDTKSGEQRHYGAYGSAPSGSSSIITETVTAFNSANVIPNSSLDTTVALPLATVGDAVLLNPRTALATGMQMAGNIYAAGVLTIRMTNSTVASIDPAAVDIDVTLIKKAPGGG